MKIVQRGNKQLRVADDRLEDMQKAGYVEVDGKNGKPLAVPAAGGDLKKENAALKKENKENAALKKENKELRAQIKELTVQLEAQAAKTKPED